MIKRDMENTTPEERAHLLHEFLDQCLANPKAVCLIVSENLADPDAGLLCSGIISLSFLRDVIEVLVNSLSQRIGVTYEDALMHLLRRSHEWAMKDNADPSKLN